MKVFNLLTACAIAAPLLFVSCNSDDIITPPDSDADGVRISFSLGVTAGPGDVASRAGDLDGDNYDKGLDGENQVKNAMIVIYDRPINSADADAGEIVKVFYVNINESDKKTFNASTDATYFDPAASFYPQSDVLNSISVGTKGITNGYHAEIEIQRNQELDLEVGKRYYAIALCNFDDMSKTFEKMSLSEFRDYVYTGKLYETSSNIKEYYDFRMTGINETSFIWQRNNKEKVDLGDFMVQRLAARVDVSFSDSGENYFLNQGSYQTNGYIELAVFSKAENSDIYTKSDVSFYLTDLKIVKAVDMTTYKDDNGADRKSGVYLIERSSTHSPSYWAGINQPAEKVYLDNEGWKNFNSGVREATKFIYSPSGKKYKDGYSLKGNSYSTIGALIDAGSFFYSSEETTSGKKRLSSIVGYIPENTCSETNYTMLRIEGYTSASPSNTFTQSRADGYDPSTDDNLNHVIGDIPIMHNTASNSHVMDYAVVRNTIYRLHIKVFANNNKIYFRWYYCGLNEDANSSNQEVYQVTAFDSKVGDNYSENPDIND